MNRIETQKQWLAEDTAYWLAARKHKNYSMENSIRCIFTLCGPKKPMVTERTLKALENWWRIHGFRIAFMPGLEDFRGITPLSFLSMPGVGMRCLIFFGALMQIEGLWKEYDLPALHYKVNNGLRSRSGWGH